MESNQETKELIKKLNRLEKENIDIKYKLKSLEKENIQIRESYDILFNNLYVYHELKPKKLLQNSREIILQMLDFIDNVCKKHNLKWFLVAGSALGALRHEGFIPWDDDCDIAMMRKDYEKFVEIIREEVIYYDLNKNIRVNTAPKINKKVMPFTKFDYLADNKLIGFIDIFPFDFISTHDESTKQRYMDEHKRLREELNKGKKRKDILKESFSRLNITLEKNKYIIPSLEVSAFAYHIYNYDDFFPLKLRKFENRYYPTPNNINAYNEVYGKDYMKLPKSIRIHDFHYRLLKEDNINNLLEKHALNLKYLNENFENFENLKNEISLKK